jgi:hypothetical protein
MTTDPRRVLTVTVFVIASSLLAADARAQQASGIAGVVRERRVPSSPASRWKPPVPC